METLVLVSVGDCGLEEEGEGLCEAGLCGVEGLMQREAGLCDAEGAELVQREAGLCGAEGAVLVQREEGLCGAELV